MLRYFLHVFRCMFVLAALSALARAQQQTQLTQECGSTRALISVFDLHGKPVPNLGNTNFRVKLGRVVSPVIGLTYEAQPRRIVVVLDTSGSMSGSSDHSKWQVAETAARGVLVVTKPDVALA